MLCSIYAAHVGRKPKSEEPVYSRLEKVRDERGITRQQLADAVEVHYQTIGYLERGEYSPSLALALRIARELAIPVEELFSLNAFSDPGASDERLT